MRLLRLFVFVGLILSLPACGGKTTPGGSGATGGKIKVAFISNNSFTFWRYAEEGCKAAEKELKEQGIDVEVVFRMPAQGTPVEQRQIIEDLKTQGVQGFAVSPNNIAGQTRYFKSLSKKVPFVLVDNDVDASDPANFEARRFYIGTNNVEAGKAAGELLKEAAPDGGEFVIFVGKLDAQNAVERREGVLVTLVEGGKEGAQAQFQKLSDGNYPIQFGKYKLLDTRTDDADAAKCQENAEDILAREKNLKAMVGLWEYNPPAMYRAARKTKRVGEVAMVGFDENETTLDAIEQGHMQGTIVQQPFEFGRQAVHAMVALVKNDEEKLKSLKADEHNRVYIPHQVIRKPDVDAFRKKLKDLLK